MDQIDAGVSAHQHLFRRHVQQLAKQTPGLWDALRGTVVAGVHTVFRAEVTAVCGVQHGGGEVELPRLWFAAGHVQVQTTGLEGMIALPKRL